MKVLMMGDSTMQFNNIYKYPQTGWAQALTLFLKTNINVLNFAKNGRSTKSFIEQGRFNALLQEVEAGDYVICSFGHNDEKAADPLRYTRPNVEYVENLAYFAKEVTSKNANIIFTTPICRHNFVDGKCVETHGEYRKAMLDFCHKNNYLCIDLDGLTLDLYNKLGEEETKKFHMIFKENVYKNYPEGKDDHTHLKPEGAIMVATLFCEAIQKTNSKFNELLIPYEEQDDFDKYMLQD